MNFTIGKREKSSSSTSRKGDQLLVSGRAQLLLVLSIGLVCVVLVVSSLAALFSSSSPSLGEELEAESSGTMVGGLMGAPKEVSAAQNSGEIDEMAQYAVKEHNAKEGKNLTFKKVVKASKQVVSGTMYHLTLEAAEASQQAKVYEVKVWTKPWESHKSLEHFKQTESSSVSPDTREASSGLREISVEDSVIKEAAEHALQKLNSKSNSLVSYELKEILAAQAEASDEETEFVLHMKVSRGTKEEQVKACLHRTAEKKWTVKDFSIV